MMTPKRKLLEKAIKDGTFEKVNQLLSAAHILMWEACNLYDEADEAMQKDGLMIGEIKKLKNIYMKAADNYFNCFKQFIGTQDLKMEMFTDLDNFDEVFRKMAGLTKDDKEQDKGE